MTPGDTIVAISTPPGRGAIAVVRLSGSRAVEIAATLGAHDLPPRHPKLRVLRDSRGRPLDSVLATRFDPPRTFTGELVIELSGHGGVLAPSLIVDAACAAGARPAEPGEFTRRAFLNGRLDLIQAEALGDLIDSNSERLLAAAMDQVSGALSGAVEALRGRVVDLQAAVAYDIDFPEEDDGPVEPGTMLLMGRAVGEGIDRLLEVAPEGERLRSGALVVMAGRPNAGKSTLFNALLGRARAIVTATPGTTRDAIEADVSMNGFPFRLVDTAGLREARGEAEIAGMEIARGYLARADAVLLCVEAEREVSGAERQVVAMVEESGSRVIWLRTKSDLDPPGGTPKDSPWGTESEPLAVSGTTGAGIATLQEALVGGCFSGLQRERGDRALVTRKRQRRALAAAKAEIEGFRRALSDGQPPEIAATHLEDCRRELAALLGEGCFEDVLARLFSRFCVGK